MVADIFDTIPWQCGERDCRSPGGWHKSNIWVDDTADTGYTIDRYSDGDHDDLDPEDVPSADESRAAWAEYATWVAQEGQDPLGEYMVPRTVTHQRRTYSVTIAKSVIGLMVVRLRRNHRSIPLDEIGRVPPLSEYLETRRTKVGRWLVAARGGFTTLEDIAAQHHKRIRQGLLLTIDVTVEIRRPDADKRERQRLMEMAATHVI